MLQQAGGVDTVIGNRAAHSQAFNWNGKACLPSLQCCTGAEQAQHQQKLNRSPCTIHWVHIREKARDREEPGCGRLGEGDACQEADLVAWQRAIGASKGMQLSSSF